MKSQADKLTFRRKVARSFFFCVILAAILASIASYVVSNYNVLDELEASERYAAVYLLGLEQKTDLPMEEIAALAANSSLTIRLVSESDAHLTAQELEALDNQLVVTREGNFSALPVTYVRIGDRLARIAPMANYNLQHMSILRFFFSILFFLMALMLLGMAFSGRIASPIARLRKATQQVAQGDFTVRVAASGRDELSCLMKNFNDMVEALARNEYLQKDFISNVSHELKTPIASILGFARLLQSEGLDEATRREYVDIIADESQRLSHLSQNLLRLSSLDRVPVTEAKPYALDEQLRRMVVQLEPTWESKAINWELDLSPTTVTAHEELLAEVWINLLANAIKFSSQDGVIQITFKPDDISQLMQSADLSELVSGTQFMENGTLSVLDESCRYMSHTYSALVGAQSPYAPADFSGNAGHFSASPYQSSALVCYRKYRSYTLVCTLPYREVYARRNSAALWMLALGALLDLTAGFCVTSRLHRDQQ